MSRRRLVPLLAAACLAALAVAGETQHDAVAGIHYNLLHPRQVLPRALAVIESGMEEGIHIGAQMYVSRYGKPVADFGVGASRKDVQMTPDTMMIWYSATKPVTAISVAQNWERGKFDLDDAVASYIPEFGVKGKDKITIRHILTHTGGFPRADKGKAFVLPWDSIIKLICDAELEEGWVPGQRAAYHGSASWFILGELIRRVDGRHFRDYVREEIFTRLGMDDCWVGLSPERLRAYGDRIGLMHLTRGGKLRQGPKDEHIEWVNNLCIPGANGRGPMRQLGRFYEMLLLRGRRDDVRIVSPQAVEAFTSYHRVNMFDEAFKAVLPWGLGFNLDSIMYGMYCSPRTFGHGGSLSSVAFCDPEHGLVAAMVFNGRPELQKHVLRLAKTSSAIYEDLGIVEPGAPWRKDKAEQNDAENWQEVERTLANRPSGSARD